MYRWAIVVGLAACGHPSIAHQGPDASPPPTYSIVAGASDVIANPLHPRAIAVTGGPDELVQLTLDRTSAGVLAQTSIQLDGNGEGATTLTPCYEPSAGCLGPVTITMELAASPGMAVADAGLNIIASPYVGDLPPCQTTSNVFYLIGNDHLLSGEYQSDPLAMWTVDLGVDSLGFSVPAIGGQYHAGFSLFEVPLPLAPGVFEDARRPSAQIAGHPGLEIMTPGLGCNEIAGRFQIHQYAPDPQTGALGSVTASFVQYCDQPAEMPAFPQMVMGCVHYEKPLSTTTTPPAPDPTKVSVQALSTTSGTPNGQPDPNARAIFTATDGTVVLDTFVNAYGQAEASLPSGGTLTVIQTGGTDIRSWRGVVNGNHFVTHQAGPTNGTRDDMLVTYTPPAGSAVGVVTGCGGGTPILGKPGYATMPFYDGCRTPTFDMLAVAAPASGGAPDQFIWQANVPHVPFGNAAVTGTWTPYSTATVTITNVPNPFSSINTRWSTTIGSNAEGLSTSQLIQYPVAGTNQVTLSYPPGAGSRTNIVIAYGNPYGGPSEDRTASYAVPPSNVTFDLSSQPVPKLSAMQQTRTGATWTQTAGNADVRTVVWQSQLSNFAHVTWMVTEPNDGLSTTTLPAIPAADAALDPTKDANALASGIAIIYDDYDVVTGYALFPPTGDYRSHRSLIQLSGNHPFPP